MLQKPMIEEPEEQVVETVEEPTEELENAPVEHPEDLESEEDGPFVHPEDMELEGDPEQPEEGEMEEEESVESGESEIVAALREELRALREDMAASRQPAEAEEETPAGPVVEPISGVSFVGEEEDVTDLTMSAQGMNEFGARILNAAVQAAVTHAFEIAQAEANKAVSIYAYSTKFYTDYPELRGHGQIVEDASKEIEAANPQITPQQLFVETAKAAYRKIGKKMPTAQKRRAPGFTKAQSASAPRGSGKKPKTVQQDVLDLIKYKGIRL